LERVYFATPAIARFHSDFSRATFEEVVDRKNGNSKLMGMLENVPFCLYELQHFTRLNKRGIKADLSLMRKIRYINFFFALIVNSFLIIFRDIFDESGVMHAFKPLSQSSAEEVILFILGILMCISYVLSFVFWLILQYPLEKNLIVLDEEEKLRKAQEERLKEE
jgi:hypothetical protein